MSRGVNEWRGIGNITKPLELRYAQSGTAVLGFSIACNDRRKEGGEWVDGVEFINLVAFGKTAENIAQYCDKGSQIYAEGSLRTRKWADKDGRDRWTTEIITNSVLFLGSPSNSGQSDGGSSGGGFNSDEPPPF